METIDVKNLPYEETIFWDDSYSKIKGTDENGNHINFEISFGSSGFFTKDNVLFLESGHADVYSGEIHCVNSSSAILYHNSKGTFACGSYGTLKDNAIAMVQDYAVIEAHDYSIVDLHDNALGKIEDSSHATCYYESRVHATDSAFVELRDHSFGTFYGDSTCVAKDDSIAKIHQENVQVKPSDKAIIILYHGRTPKIEKDRYFYGEVLKIKQTHKTKRKELVDIKISKDILAVVELEKGQVFENSRGFTNFFANCSPKIISLWDTFRNKKIDNLDNYYLKNLNIDIVKKSYKVGDVLEFYQSFGDGIWFDFHKEEE